MGRTVRVPAIVHRVISLAPSTTEVLFALGAGSRVVGVDGYSDFPKAATAIEKVGSDLDPSLERILALRPDIVFTATSANAQKTVEAIERLGIAVYVSSPKHLDQILTDVRRIADALGDAPSGERLAADLTKRVAAVHDRIAAAPKVKALSVVWPDPLVVAGRDTHVDDLLRAAGAENAASDATGYPTYSIERVIASAPEVVVFGTHANAEAGTTVPPGIARLSTVPAVRDKRVYGVDGDILFRPGPRVVDGIERLAALFHPPAGSAAK
jgi:iron complex transport system substrate-binding protein